MEGLNYFREAFEFFKRTGKVMGTKDFARAFQKAVKAPKFILPEGGKILDNDLKGLSGTLRLPYPTIVIEYSCDDDFLKDIVQEAHARGANDPEMQLLLKGMYKRDKVIIVATQADEGRIEIYVLSHSQMQKRWIVAPVDGLLPTEYVPDVGWSFTATQADGAAKALGMSEAWFKEVTTAVLRAPVRAIYELLEALSFSNISEMEIPAKKQTFTERRKKALPYDSYRVLVVDKKHQIVGAKSSKGEGDHTGRSPREHTRRGHERTYKKTGLKIWINPVVVNAGVAGKVVKDYKLK